MANLPALPAAPVTSTDALLYGIALRLDRLIELAEGSGTPAVAETEPAQERQPAPVRPTAKKATARKRT